MPQILPATTATKPIVRVRIALYGAVQGVGFRPFVYRLAQELDLAGWVINSASGLMLEVEGEQVSVIEFARRLDTERPPPAVVLASETTWLESAGFSGFEIRHSDDEGEKSAAVLPDLATCPHCLDELFDSANRRFQYPFTNCTLCGPRYTIVHDIPYDRPNTTMRDFVLCDDCSREYADPADRRFHAQPNACPRCGPKLSALVEDAARALGRGEIVALKGIGGFQLLADARSSAAVSRLRQRKHREEKPFAIMMPSLAAIREYCEVAPEEEKLLRSGAAPIVLLRPNGGEGIAPEVAKSSPYIGVMLPYSPLHHLLLGAFPHPVVATSGNRSDEPIATENTEALERLGGIADFFLLHDRPIARPCDDSVVRLSRGRESVLRRARGYAPLPVRVSRDLPAVLSVGAHLKNTVAIAIGRQVYLSQHIGDLDTYEARQSFERAIDDLCRLYRFKPEIVACDLHPDYASTRWAHETGLPVAAVQHHHAHAAACAAENDVQGDYLAVTWDGTGYGLDGTIWGGEMFLCESGRFERIAHLRPFRLPGGDAAVREGWRVAAALLLDANLDPHGRGLPEQHLPLIGRMIEREVNSPVTTSMGRLFDAVAALAGIADRNRFEGQAAMQFERAIGGFDTDDAYPLPGGDWRPLIEALVRDRSPLDHIAARFHNALVEWILDVAQQSGVDQVALSGGTFQNRYLTERAAARLEGAGFRVFTHQRVPANDGGIALGQAVLAGV